MILLINFSILIKINNLLYYFSNENAPGGGRKPVETRAGPLPLPTVSIQLLILQEGCVAPPLITMRDAVRSHLKKSIIKDKFDFFFVILMNIVIKI